MSRETLRRILDEHAFRMNDEQFDHVFSKFSNDPDGNIDYKDFLKEYSCRPDVHRASSATPMQSREQQVGLNMHCRLMFFVGTLFTVLDSNQEFLEIYGNTLECYNL